MAAAEGRAVLEAAGIPHVAEEISDVEGRWRRWGVRDIDGRRRAGSSTWQSLARGTGALETDYLNGEIVLLGRLHGVPTPINAAAVRAGRRRGARRPRPREPVRRRRSGGPGMSAAIDPLIAAEAEEIAASASAELQELVDISSPSGDIAGAERALAVCVRLLPEGAVVHRPECSSRRSRP